MAHVSLTFGNLTQLANSLGDDASIVVKNGGFESRGKVGSFFTLKSTNRHAGNVLFAAVRQQYGDAVANALAPQMRASREEGKPLSARVVRDVLADAAAMSAGIPRINEDMARHFVLGNAGPGDTRNLDAAMDAFCEGKNVSPAARNQLKNRFGEALLRSVGREGQKIFSYADMTEMVRTASLPAMKKAWNDVQVEAFMNDPVHGADAAIDDCASRLGLDGAQKHEFRRLVGMALSHEAGVAAEKGTMFDPQTLYRSVSEGSLTALKNFAYACGKTGDVDFVARDMLAWSTAQTAADLSMLAVQIGNLAGIAAGSLAAQRLDDMRAMQPEGMLSRETLWQGCFREAMPDNLKDADFRDFNSAVFDRLGEEFKKARPGSATAAADGMTALATGVSFEKTLASLSAPVTLTLADFRNMPSLTPVANLGSFQEVEESLAKDLKRRGTHNSLPGYTPSISFGAAGGKAEVVHIQDLSGMSEADRAQFSAGNPSGMSRNLVEHARRLCGDNDVQARQVIQSMGQSGAFLVRSNSSMTGVFESEHSPLDIDVRREENGNVTMRFYKPEASPLDVDYTYTITPDGRGVLTACRMQARNPQPAQAQAAAE